MLRSSSVDNLALASMTLNVLPIAVLRRAATECRLKSADLIAEQRLREYSTKGYEALPAYVKVYCSRMLTPRSNQN